MADEVVNEDANFGGTETVLAGALLEYGLPPEAGLTGLLRHMQGNRVLTEAILNDHIDLLQQRVAAFVAGIRTMMDNGSILELFEVARSIGMLEELRGDNVATGKEIPQAQVFAEGPFVTKSGKVLTDAEVEALSDEAEGKGHDD